MASSLRPSPRCICISLRSNSLRPSLRDTSHVGCSVAFVSFIISFLSASLLTCSSRSVETGTPSTNGPSSGGCRLAFLYTHANDTESLARATWSRPKRTACSLRARGRGQGQKRSTWKATTREDAVVVRQPETARVHGEDDLSPAPVSRGDFAPLRERERVERRADGVETLHAVPREGARCGRE